MGGTNRASEAMAPRGLRHEEGTAKQDRGDDRVLGVSVRMASWSHHSLVAILFSVLCVVF